MKVEKERSKTYKGDVDQRDFQETGKKSHLAYTSASSLLYPDGLSLKCLSHLSQRTGNFRTALAINSSLEVILIRKICCELALSFFMKQRLAHDAFEVHTTKLMKFEARPIMNQKVKQYFKMLLLQHMLHASPMAHLLYRSSYCIWF